MCFVTGGSFNIWAGMMEEANRGNMHAGTSVSRQECIGFPYENLYPTLFEVPQVFEVLQGIGHRNLMYRGIIQPVRLLVRELVN